MNGTIDIANSPCVSSGTIAGVADAGSVTFGSVEAGNEIQFEGTISADGTSMEGTYSNGTNCGTDGGSWSARRNP
jgi:spore coat protein U-like protein